MCDEKGSIIDGDQIIAAIAMQWKKKRILKGGVIGTLMSNYGLEKFFKQKKIKLKPFKVNVYIDKSGKCDSLCTKASQVCKVSILSAI